VAKAEQYAKLINIEANTMVYMVHHLYLPAIFDYSGDLATSVATKAELGVASAAERSTLERLVAGADKIDEAVNVLEDLNGVAQGIDDCKEQDEFYAAKVLPAMEALRAEVDAMESICSRDHWPVPSYNHMLFYV